MMRFHFANETLSCPYSQLTLGLRWLQKTTATGFFTLAASRWWMIIGHARVSTTEQNLGLDHHDLKPAFDAPVD